MSKTKVKKKGRYRFDIVIAFSIFILLVSFCAYMVDTSLEDVLNQQYPDGIVTHDYTYDDTESK